MWISTDLGKANKVHVINDLVLTYEVFFTFSRIGLKGFIFLKYVNNLKLKNQDHKRDRETVDGFKVYNHYSLSSSYIILYI